MNTSARVPVLMYHRVGDAQNDWEAKYSISIENFVAHVDGLMKKGYRAVPIDTLVEWLEGGSPLPAGSFLLTFDDGYRGVLHHALPILQEIKWPFTVFLVTDRIGEDDSWTKTVNPDGRTHALLSGDEVRTMQDLGVCFHSHTQSHPSLPTLNEKQLAEELAGSRSTLSELLGREVRYLAYPFGQVDERVEAATRVAGYRAAFSTQPGFNRRNVNRFRIRRIDVFGTDTVNMLLRKVRFGSNDGSLKHSVRYYLGRLGSRVRRVR